MKSTNLKLFKGLLLLFPFLLLDCSSGKKAFEKGNYLEAVEQSVNRLRQNPDNRKAQNTLRSAYPNLISYYQDRINNLKRSGNALRWEEIMNMYADLNEVYDDIQRAPGARSIVVSPRNFISEYEAARLKAAEAYYAIGEDALKLAQQGDRESAKEAYLRFDQTVQLIATFRDARNLRDEALELATIYVEVLPIPMHSRSLSLSNEFFQNQIFDYLRNREISPFVQFYTEEEIRAFAKRPDHRVEMIFDDFVVGQAFIRETIEQRVRDSVVIGQVEVVENGEKVQKDVYGTVKAEVHIFKKELESRGLLDFRIIDSRANSVIEQEKFPGTSVWVDHWGFYNGDERALTKEDERHLKNKREIMPPPPQDLFISFTEPIYDQATSFLRRFYRNF